MKFRLRHFTPLLAALPALAACQTTPVQPKVQEAPMPPAVELPPPPQVPAELTKQITAADAVQIALANQRSLQIAAANIQTAAGRKSEAQSGLNPSLDASGSYSRSETFRSSASGPSGSSAGFSSGVTLKQLIFDFNHTVDSVRQAAAQERAAQHDFTRAQSDLVLSVKSAYYNFVESGALVTVGEANLNSRTYQLALARARFNAGVGQPVDVVQAETNLGDAEQSLVQARASLLNTRVSLALAMGIDPRTPLNPAPAHEPDEPTADMNSLVTLALAQRPEILSARESLRAAGYGLAAARTLNAPNLSLSLAANSKGLRDPLESSGGTAALGLSWPIFDGGFQAGRMQEARAARQSASSSLVIAQQQVVSDVSQSFVNVKSAEQRKTITAAQVVNAQEGVRIAQGRYQAGVGTFVDVTTAQAQLVAAETNDANAQASLDIARASLARAIGRSIPLSGG